MPVLFLALSSSTKSEGIIQRDGCIANLRQIDEAKEKWALEFKKRSGEKPDDEALAPHLKVPLLNLQCPAGGRYTLNEIGNNPQCSVAGHALD